MYQGRSQPEQADVLIVGAGLSGLTAAYALQRQKPELNVRILEARDRIGGRILTVNDTTTGYGFDLGPTWVWPGHHHVLELVEKLGIALFPQYETGDAVFDRGVDVPPQRSMPHYICQTCGTQFREAWLSRSSQAIHRQPSVSSVCAFRRDGP